MAKKRADKKTLEVGKDLTGDAILGNGNTIHKPIHKTIYKTIIQNINFSDKHSSDTEDLKVPDEKVPSTKQVTPVSDYSGSIKQNVESIIFNSALIWEHVDPQLATRTTQAKLRDIYDRLLHINYQNPFDNAEFAKERIAAFNKVTGWEFTEYDIELIDYFLGNPKQILVWLVFEQIYKDSFEKEWEIYRSCLKGQQHVEFKKEGEDVYKQINDWLQSNAERIYKIVKRNFPGLAPKEHSIPPLEWPDD